MAAAAVAAAGGAPAAAAAPRRGPIRTGQHVVFRDAEGSLKVFHLGEGRKDVRLPKYPPIPVEAILAAPYGATLRRSEGGQWVRRRPADTAGAAVAVAGEAAGGEDAHEGNRHLAQDNSAQALSPSEVSDLKGRCTGEEVVEALASNSATFASKTKFAQEKYLKKKQQKHVQQVTLLQPTVMNLCEAYMAQSRSKVCGLRFDYLSNLLCQADVHTGGRYLVLDSACGLVCAAMALQLAGNGRVFRVYRDGCPDRALMELDLGERRSLVRQVPLDVLRSPDAAAHEWLRAPAEPAGDAAAGTEEERAKLAGRRERVRVRREDLSDLLARPVHAVVIVPAEDEGELAADALEAGLRRLGPGGRLAVFGHHLQPLAARQAALRADSGFVDVRLHQLFTREYQVLPQRTHPLMTADAQLCEGFLLTATKVVDPDEVPADEAAPAAADEAAPVAPEQPEATADAEPAEKRSRTA